MPRKLGNTKNELKIQDPVSGSEISLYYRVPTSEERIKYSSASFEWIDGQLKIVPAKARQKFGIEILDGFKEGSFQKEQEGQWIDLTTSDPDWKSILMEFASDLIEALAMHVFEGVKISSSQNEGFSQKN